jgi:excisionase family DNA binding protein
MHRQQPELLTIQDFASILQVTTACVRRWITERKITTVKLGRLVRIPADEIERLVSKGMRPAHGNAK